jgi:hypothetical protein
VESCTVRSGLGLDAAFAGAVPGLPFDTKARAKARQKKQEKLQRRALRKQMEAAGAEPPPAAGCSTGLDYGGFERHTTGFGSKMLAKWGFGGEGRGLGRNQQVRPCGRAGAHVSVHPFLRRCLLGPGTRSLLFVRLPAGLLVDRPTRS